MLGREEAGCRAGKQGWAVCAACLGVEVGEYMGTMEPADDLMSSFVPVWQQPEVILAAQVLGREAVGAEAAEWDGVAATNYLKSLIALCEGCDGADEETRDELELWAEEPLWGDLEERANQAATVEGVLAAVELLGQKVREFDDDQLEVYLGRVGGGRLGQLVGLLEPESEKESLVVRVRRYVEGGGLEADVEFLRSLRNDAIEAKQELEELDEIVEMAAEGTARDSQVWYTLAI